MKNNSLFHYCSFESFFKIIKSRTIKLSEIAKSNDSQEINFLLKHYVSYIKTHAKNPYTPSTLQHLINNQLTSIDFLAIGFSEKQDDLHMWNCYAKGGVSIGFDYKKLCDWAKHIYVFDNGIAFDRNVDYGQAVLSKIVYCNDKSAESIIESECYNAEHVTDSLQSIFKKAPFIKNEFWKAEKEWRISIPLIYSDGFIHDSIPNCVLVPEKVEMSIEKKGQFPICVGCFIPFDPEMIVSITLAPDCRADFNDLKKMLHIYGFDHLQKNNKIFFSKGTIR